MNVYILDTDHVTLHQRGHAQVIAQCHQRLPNQLAVTVISVEEQMRGRLAQIGHPNASLASAYGLLGATLDYFCDLMVLPFDAAAHRRYEQLRGEGIRIGTLDLRIAAIVLQRNAILVTRNRRDFGRVPGLKLENWSQ